MESSQSSETKTINCMFKSYCGLKDNPELNGYCVLCRDKGLYYLISKHYLIKTLIPKIYLSKQIIELDLQGEATEALFYLDNIYKLVKEGKGMYCWGEQTGTGKTTVCSLALLRFLFEDVQANPYMTDNRRVLYINTPEFLDRIRKSYSSEDESLEQLMEELFDLYRAPKLILFDDIGAEKSTEWVQERLYSILNFRAANGLACLFTSNLSLDQLERKLGSRIASRIRGFTRDLKFSGKDHRRCTW